MNEYTWQEYCNRVRRLEKRVTILEQESILDKIRAEIEQWHKDGTNWNDIRLMKIEEILDKHKVENCKMLICPECGLDVHSDYKTCPRCGAKVRIANDE